MLRPWVVALTLTDLMYLKLGYDPQSGVEEQLMARTQTDGRATAGLETLDEELGQLEHLSGRGPGALSGTDAAGSEGHRQRNRPDAERLAYAVTARNWRRSCPMPTTSSRSCTGYWSASAISAGCRRSRRTWRADHNVLIVVGALHVVGKGGLLDLLRNAGIVATPVLAAGAPGAAQGPSSSRH